VAFLKATNRTDLVLLFHFDSEALHRGIVRVKGMPRHFGRRCFLHNPAGDNRSPRTAQAAFLNKHSRVQRKRIMDGGDRNRSIRIVQKRRLLARSPEFLMSQRPVRTQLLDDGLADVNRKILFPERFLSALLNFHLLSRPIALGFRHARTVEIRAVIDDPILSGRVGDIEEWQTRSPVC
jgi:hypothetical protein